MTPLVSFMEVVQVVNLVIILSVLCVTAALVFFLCLQDSILGPFTDWCSFDAFFFFLVQN